MRIVFTCICIITVFVASWAQPENKVSLLLEQDFTSGSKGFCTPGVSNKSRSRGLEITYNLSGGGFLESGEGDATQVVGQMNSLESINLKVHVPVLLKEDFKILLGYQYQPQRYSFSENIGVNEMSAQLQPYIGNISNQNLKSNAFSVLATKAINEKYYTVLRLKVGFSGAYDGWVNFGDQYANFNAIGLFGIKKSEDFEWGVGILYSQNIRRQLLLPFVMMNKNFNDKWGIETAPPAYVLGRYNVSPKSILLFGAEYNSNIFSIEPNSFNTLQAPRSSQPTVFSMNNRSFSAVVSLEQQIVPWVWLNIKTGFQYNLNSRLEMQIPGTDTMVRFRPPNAPFLQMGIFLSHPDKFMK